MLFQFQGHGSDTDTDQAELLTTRPPLPYHHLHVMKMERT
jgi:hypothetical protein